jgi:phage/plasmid-associated DNA primase
MLVKRAFETEGVVKDCETVTKASQKYRKGQDHIAAFIDDMIIKTGNEKDVIKKTGLNSAFKKWFEESQGTRKPPKVEELHECMNKKRIKYNGKAWVGVKFYEPDDEDQLNEL